MRWLPAVVGEGLVGLRHLVDILATLEGGALTCGGVEDLVGETLGHRVFAALAGEVDEPTDGERAATPRTNLDRHLVRGSSDAARSDLDGRTHVVDRLLQDGDGVLAGDRKSTR